MDGHCKGAQTFIHEKHYILSSELKNLYVAVTRARQQIWIYDENTEWREPICEYWEHHGLVNINDTLSTLEKEQQDDWVSKKKEKITLSTLAEKEKSSPDEWDQKGKIFFEKQQYGQVKLQYLSCNELS